MKKLLLFCFLILASGCKTNQLLAKGLKNKAITANANVFIAEVTPANDVTHTPTGRVIIASGVYSSTPIGEKGKSYIYHREVNNPKILGFIGGSNTSTTIIAVNNKEEMEKALKLLGK